MEHHFRVEDAQKYGVNAAILLYNITFWVLKNKANDRHFYDGKHWTYNSIKAFNALFPYMTEKQIRIALEKLESEGAIETGNYNKDKYDRTKWYCLKGQMHLAERANGFSQKGEPIPDSKPDNKQYIYDENFKETYKTKKQLAEQIGIKLKPKVRTTKQQKVSKAFSLIDYFKERAQELHGLTYLSRPEDKNGQIQKKVIECADRMEDPREFVDWWLDGAGDWATYEPAACFTSKTYQQFENRKVKDNKPKFSC